MVMACDFLPCSVTVTRFYARFGALAHEDCRNNAIWCTKKRRKKQDMAHGKTHTKKNTIWRTNKRRKNIAHGKNTHKKKTIWCTKKRRNKHDIVREKQKKKHDLAHEEINETWHGCVQRCVFSDEKMLLYIEVFLWKKSKKNTI